MADVRSDSEETLALLTAFERGEAEFDTLFKRHRAALRAQIRVRMDIRLRQRVELSDIVQETEIEACRRIDDFLQRRPMPFHLWLRKTAHELVVQLRRRHVVAAVRSVDRELPLPDESSLVLARQFIAREASPSEVMNTRELADRVRVAVAQLPESDREIIIMRTYENLPYEEIACLLEIETATARKRHGRALIRLHTLLTDGGLTESQI